MLLFRILGLKILAYQRVRTYAEVRAAVSVPVIARVAPVSSSNSIALFISHSFPSLRTFHFFTLKMCSFTLLLMGIFFSISYVYPISRVFLINWFYLKFPFPRLDRPRCPPLVNACKSHSLFWFDFCLSTFFFLFLNTRFIAPLPTLSLHFLFLYHAFFRFFPLSLPLFCSPRFNAI